MLLHFEGDGVVCIGQPAHAWVSGRLASAWGNAAFVRPERRAAFCLGAEQHDLGWLDWERRPALNPDTGFPFSFVEAPLATRLGVWQDAAHTALALSPHAALLVSLHGHALFRARAGDPGVDRYLAAEIAFQQDLMGRLGVSPDEARRAQQLIWALDHLALVGLIPAWAPQDHPIGDQSIRVETAGDRHVTIDPWPFATDGAITLDYPGRRLTEPSVTESELHARLTSAPWVDIPVTWSPA